jgi:hypothetical protein
VFAARAIKDGGSGGAKGIPLQKLQIIKLWVEDGAVRERIVDIAASTGGAASVDPDTCVATTSGADALCAVWRDDEFDAAVPAVYYGRAIEDPTCRWSTRACNDAGIRCDRPATIRRGWEGCCDGTFPPVIQERAWTSPIWYTPATP